MHTNSQRAYNRHEFRNPNINRKGWLWAIVGWRGKPCTDYRAIQTENRIATMNKAGVGKLILSVPAHVFMYWTGKFDDEYAAICNDKLRHFANRHLIVYLWHTNIANPEQAVKEIDCAVHQLGPKRLAVGGANFGGIQAHDERFFSV